MWLFGCKRFSLTYNCSLFSITRLLSYYVCFCDHSCDLSCFLSLKLFQSHRACRRVLHSCRDNKVNEIFHWMEKITSLFPSSSCEKHKKVAMLVKLWLSIIFLLRQLHGAEGQRIISLLSRVTIYRLLFCFCCEKAAVPSEARRGQRWLLG